MKRLAIILVLFALITCSSSDDDNITGGDGTTADWSGTYDGYLTINRRESFDPYFPIETIDSVSFDLHDPDFLLTFHTANSNLCNVVGQAIVNSMTGFITLTPIAPVGSGNCVTTRWPQGVFVASLDSLDLDMTGQFITTLDPTRDDTIKYRFDLVKK